MENDPYTPPTQNLETGRDEGHFHTTSGPGRSRQGSAGVDGLEALRHSNDDRYSNPTTEESVELDDMVSESGLSDDEETGLTSKERSERRRRKKRRTHLDARIAEDLDLKVSKEEKKLADVSVVRRLLVDAALIGSWYEFSG
jgi:solute carrier family 35, member C2